MSRRDQIIQVPEQTTELVVPDFSILLLQKTGKGHVFSNINKNEYDNLVEFISND
jgi:hypothetical protein